MTTGLDDNGLWIDAPSAITVWSGRKVDPLDALTNDIRIEDIAHALARQCRYNGHTAGHLSVARHSLWVANKLHAIGDPVIELQGLLHDAAEAYLGDLVRPLKYNAALGIPFREAERELETVIAAAFGLPWLTDVLVKDADTFVCVELEMPRPHGFRWTWHGDYREDEGEFLQRYGALRRLV